MIINLDDYNTLEIFDDGDVVIELDSEIGFISCIIDEKKFRDIIYKYIKMNGDDKDDNKTECISKSVRG